MCLHLRTLREENNIRNAESMAMYNFILVEIMKNMQNHLLAMEPPTGEDHAAYLKSVHKVAAAIKQYGTGICQLSRFYLIPSRHYRPPKDDPEFYAQGILNYSSNLHSRRQQTSFEIFFYLIGGWKKALVSGQGKVGDHRRHIERAMRDADFMLFLLEDFLPAILRTGFRHLFNRQSMIYLAYFPSLAEAVGELLNYESPLAGTVFERVMNLLRIIWNCLLAKHEHSLHLIYPFPTRYERSIRSMACLFWLDVTPHIHNYTRRVGDEHSFQKVNEPFLDYLRRIDDDLDSLPVSEGDWEIPRWSAVEGEYCVSFENTMEEDINKHYRIEGSMATIIMGVTTHRVELSTLDEWIPTFKDVLQHGRIGRYAKIPKDDMFLIMDRAFIF